jgi:hypothetical protein
MGFLDSFFKRKGKSAQPRTTLEKFLDGITPAYMDEIVKKLKEDMKVPFTQAMSVLVFSRSFTQGLYSFSQELPEPFKTSWNFPHDRIFTEVVSFYFFCLLREYLGKPQRNDDEDEFDYDDEDEEEDNRLKDPYASSLVSAMHLSGKLIHDLADTGLVEEFVRNRTISYSLPFNKEGLVDRLQRFIFEAWNPDKSGQICLELSAPHIPIMAHIATMPIDAVEDSCKGLYQEKLKNPSAF